MNINSSGDLTTGVLLTVGKGQSASKSHLTDIATAGWIIETGG